MRSAWIEIISGSRAMYWVYQHVADLQRILEKSLGNTLSPESYQKVMNLYRNIKKILSTDIDVIRSETYLPISPIKRSLEFLEKLNQATSVKEEHLRNISEALSWILSYHVEIMKIPTIAFNNEKQFYTFLKNKLGDEKITEKLIKGIKTTLEKYITSEGIYTVFVAANNKKYSIEVWKIVQSQQGDRLSRYSAINLIDDGLKYRMKRPMYAISLFIKKDKNSLTIYFPEHKRIDAWVYKWEKRKEKIGIFADTGSILTYKVQSGDFGFALEPNRGHPTAASIAHTIAYGKKPVLLFRITI